MSKIREEEALRALAFQEMKYQYEINKKKKLTSDFNHALERREDLGKTPIGISAFKIEQDLISGLKQRLTQADYAIFRALKNVEKARLIFSAAKSRSKMMESLYEKAYSEYKKEADRQELKAMDELNLMRFRLHQEEKL